MKEYTPEEYFAILTQRLEEYRKIDPAPLPSTWLSDKTAYRLIGNLVQMMDEDEEFGEMVAAFHLAIMGGGKLTEMLAEVMDELDKILPPAWSHNSPIDILGDASPERYAKSLETGSPS